MVEKLDVGEICNRTVVFANEDMPLKEAAGLMRTEHVGSLVIVREAQAGRIVVGMLTDRDVAIVAVAREFDPQTLRVADVMSGNPVTARAADSIHEVLGAMRRGGVRRVPVTTDEGVLVGIVTLDDLLDIFAEELNAFTHAIASERKREQLLRV